MTSYIQSGKLQQCYGCRACEQVCAKGAISMQPNEEGFLYPVINQDQCINCGLCVKICPYDTAAPMHKPLKAYAMQYKNEERLMNSSSGAAFPALADYILAHGGYVAGCIFNEKIEAVHVLTNKIDVVKKMSGSKYVQSDLGNIYPEIKKVLLSDKFVLFSGTPCQVAGLLNYLRKPHEKLITVDLICHGVPSPSLLQDYIHSTYKGKLVDLKFRNKKMNGWCSQGSAVVCMSNGKTMIKKTSPYIDSYYYYYLQNNVSRMCCYECSFSTKDRVSDITIGDYWNVKEVFPSIEEKNGVSAILINTEKGERIYRAIKDSLISYESKIEDVVARNGNLQSPCEKPEQRSYIYKKIKEKGYSVAAKEECNYQYVIPFMKSLIPSSLKQAIKKILSIIKR